MTMQWISDFRHAWRGLVRTPGFLVTSVGTLALAIGAVAGMFSVVDTVLLRPLPFPDSDRLVVLAGTAPGSDLPERFGLGLEFYFHYKENSKLLDGIFMFGAGHVDAAHGQARRTHSDGVADQRHVRHARRASAARAAPRPGGRRSGRLISDRLWSTWFGRDSAVIGKIVLRLRRDAAGHRRHAPGVPLPERRDDALGGRTRSGSAKCAPGSSARPSSRA